MSWSRGKSGGERVPCPGLVGGVGAVVLVLARGAARWGRVCAVLVWGQGKGRVEIPCPCPGQGEGNGAWGTLVVVPPPLPFVYRKNNVKNITFSVRFRKNLS